MRPRLDKSIRLEDPFVLVLSTLEEGESRIERSGTAADLDIDPREIRLLEPVVLTARCYRSGEQIELQGELTTRLDLTCDACLDPIPTELRVPIRIFAERLPSRDHRSLEEIREEDAGIIYHDGRLVVLTEELRQSLMVEVPWHARCSADCLGLCPHCGANLNRGPCGCPESTVPPPQA